MLIHSDDSIFKNISVTEWEDESFIRIDYLLKLCQLLFLITLTNIIVVVVLPVAFYRNSHRSSILLEWGAAMCQKVKYMINP